MTLLSCSFYLHCLAKELFYLIHKSTLSLKRIIKDNIHKIYKHTFGRLIKFGHSVFDLFSRLVKNSAVWFCIYSAVWIRLYGQVRLKPVNYCHFIVQYFPRFAYSCYFFVCLIESIFTFTFLIQNKLGRKEISGSLALNPLLLD